MLDTYRKGEGMKLFIILSIFMFLLFTGLLFVAIEWIIYGIIDLGRIIYEEVR